MNIKKKKAQSKISHKKEIRKFNREVFVGLLGGLLVVLSQLVIEEVRRIFTLPDNYFVNMIMVVGFTFLIFVLFAFSMFKFSKK